MKRNLPAKFPGLPTTSAAPPRRSDRVQARLDVATTSDEDAPHWRRLAPLLSAVADLPEVDRRAAWSKVRHEAQNNPHLRGQLKTLVNTIVGKGPRLQMQTGDEARDRAIEKAFATWCRKAKWAKKLRQMLRGYFVDGEGLTVAVTNRRLPTAVKLDFRNAEPEQLTTPTDRAGDPNVIDGIEFDADGQPATYYFLPYHPGDPRHVFTSLTLQPQAVDASLVAHLFDAERPGQVHGYSHYAAAVQPLADVRRFTRATLGTAERVANIAGTIETENDEGVEADEETAVGQPWEEISIPRSGFLTTPAGTTAKPFDVPQTTQSFEGFKDTCVADAGRAAGLPRNLALGNSKDANFSSAKLDHLIYWLMVAVIQDDVGIDVCDWALGLWLDEAALVAPELVAGLGPVEEYPHAWLWGGREYENIVDEANAFTALNALGGITLAEWYGRRGLDWREQLEQWGKEQALLARLRPAASPTPSATSATGSQPGSTPTNAAWQNQREGQPV